MRAILRTGRTRQQETADVITSMDAHVASNLEMMIPGNNRDQKAMGTIMEANLFSIRTVESVKNNIGSNITTAVFDVGVQVTWHGEINSFKLREI